MTASATRKSGRVPLLGRRFGRRTAPSVALLGLLVAAVALAHAPLESTYPADGATLERVPDELRLAFARPARVVKVVLTHAGAGDASRTLLELRSKGFFTDVRLALELPGPGAYEALWRAMGEDGHVLEGTFAFEVR